MKGEKKRKEKKKKKKKTPIWKLESTTIIKSI